MTSLWWYNLPSAFSLQQIILLTTQILMMIFHLGNVYVSMNAFKNKSEFKSNRIVEIFCLLNIICFGWRIYLFSTMVTTGSNMSLMSQFVTPLMVLLTFGTLWFIVPALVKLPSLEQLNKLNNELTSKIEELETERLAKEKAQTTLLQSQKMEAVGQLTGGIAHDFNNLLMAIGGNLELIRMNPQSKKLDKWVGTGIDAVARAAHLTAQLLTFSRVQKLQLKEVQLKPLIINLKDMIKRTIGPDIKIVLADIDDVVIMADSVQLELAIFNLAINARDAMKGGGTLTLSATIDDDHVEIDVQDTGSGIPDEVVARIFEPFFTTKGVGEGTGLGLSMVYGVATQSGGDVYIKQTSPSGTIFTISMPVISVAQPVATPATIIATTAPCVSKNIFLIDDDCDVRETLREILLTKGHQVTSFEDGVEALQHLKTHKPDLVLVDYAMPVMNGAAVMKAIRLMYADLPIVFITGYSTSVDLENEKVLKKPFKIDDIRALLRTIL